MLLILKPGLSPLYLVLLLREGGEKEEKEQERRGEERKGKGRKGGRKERKEGGSHVR